MAENWGDRGLDVLWRAIIRYMAQWDTAGAAGGRGQLFPETMDFGLGGTAPPGARQGGAAVKRYWWLLVALLTLTALLAKIGAATAVP